MKNYTEILAENGITIPDDKAEAISKAMTENYKTVVEHERLTTKLAQATESLKTAQEGLKKFDGVDVESLNSQIQKLTQDLADKDTAHAAELADLAFNSAIDDAIRGAKGRNPKAIKAVLDMDALKASKNQDADIKSALENCQKENGYLFDTGNPPPPYADRTGGGNDNGGNGGNGGENVSHDAYGAAAIRDMLYGSK